MVVISEHGLLLLLFFPPAIFLLHTRRFRILHAHVPAQGRFNIIAHRKWLTVGSKTLPSGDHVCQLS
jgi:hypothetical protein